MSTRWKSMSYNIVLSWTFKLLGHALWKVHDYVPVVTSILKLLKEMYNLFFLLPSLHCRLYPVAPENARFLSKDVVLSGYKVPANVSAIKDIHTCIFSVNKYLIYLWWLSLKSHEFISLSVDVNMFFTSLFNFFSEFQCMRNISIQQVLLFGHFNRSLGLT